MLPIGGGGGGDGRTDQEPPPATGHHGRCEDVPPRSPSLLPVVTSEKKRKNPDLPNDVIIVILSRVRYRSLCRFKCVSRQWLALSSELDVLHRMSPRTLPGLYYFTEDSDGLIFHDLTAGSLICTQLDPDLCFLRGSYQRISAKECCGGLLLCKCWKSCSLQNECHYVVCNPATEKWTVLPPMEFPDRTDGYRSVEGRIFGLIQSERYLGFHAVNPSSFVVVEPLNNYSGQIRELAVYSSKTGRWTSMKSEWGPQIRVPGFAPFIFLNGIVHFATNKPSIATLDIEGRIWKEIELPHMGCSIGQSMGRLHAWHVNHRLDCQLSIWVLEDHDSGNWTLKHTVKMWKLFGRHFRKDNEFYKMLAIHPNCHLTFLTDEEMTVSYDMDNQKVDIISTSEQFLCCAPYVPCFAKWPSAVH